MQLAPGTQHSALISFLVDIMIKFMLEYSIKYVMVMATFARYEVFLVIFHRQFKTQHCRKITIRNSP